MQLRDAVGDQRELGVVPRTTADPVPRMRRLIVVSGIAFNTEIRTPGARSQSHRARKALTGRIGPGQTTKISRRAGRARDEEAHAWNG
jgi:hypothetical protein